jgi:hypothetical protein
MLVLTATGACTIMLSGDNSVEALIATGATSSNTRDTNGDSGC